MGFHVTSTTVTSVAVFSTEGMRRGQSIPMKLAVPEIATATPTSKALFSRKTIGYGHSKNSEKLSDAVTFCNI